MTESEAIRMLRKETSVAYINELRKGASDEEIHQMIQQAMEWGADAIDEIQAYKAIGTVEEFKAFRSDDFTQDLLNMGYTKGLKDGYEKAITEFAERLKTILDRKFSFGTSNKFKLFNSIDEIAEEMRCAE